MIVGKSKRRFVVNLFYYCFPFMWVKPSSKGGVDTFSISNNDHWYCSDQCGWLLVMIVVVDVWQPEAAGWHSRCGCDDGRVRLHEAIRMSSVNKWSNSRRIQGFRQGTSKTKQPASVAASSYGCFRRIVVSDELCGETLRDELLWVIPRFGIGRSIQ